MATRAELLATFEAALDGFLLPASGTADPPASSRSPRLVVLPDDKSGVLESEHSVDDLHTIEHHICYYFDLDTMNGHNAQFYVVDRGTANEAAYWMQARDPKPPPPEPTFAQEVTAWLDSQIGLEFGAGSTLVYYTVLSTLESIERGTVQVLLLNAGVLTSLMMAVWKNVADEWQFKVVTS